MMFNFFDEIFDINNVQKEDLFICSVGYEERSYHLLNKFKTKVSLQNIIVFAFEELVAKTDKPDRIKKENFESINLITSTYGKYQDFFDNIINLISLRTDQNKATNVYIDYSYMPRMWYCPLPTLLKNKFKNLKVIFLYSEGIYPKNYLEYPTAGIDSLIPYTGKPSLRCDMQRTHIISLSYDVIRTEGLLSMLDPESIITCNAYDSEFKEVHENIFSINESIISRADYSISFHLDNFSFMIAKICEVANEHISLGDVIIIPDGPKPLIFALSLAGELLKEKHGITCMQILRSNLEDPVVEVIANGKTVSFSI